MLTIAMQIFVKSLRGQTITVDAESVEHVRTQICNKEGTYICLFNLI